MSIDEGPGLGVEILDEMGREVRCEHVVEEPTGRGGEQGFLWLRAADHALNIEEYIIA